MPKIEPVQSVVDCRMEADFLTACNKRPGDVVAALRHLFQGLVLPVSVEGVMATLERRQAEIDRGA